MRGDPSDLPVTHASTEPPELWSNIAKVHLSFCQLASSPASAAHLLQIVRIAVQAVDADLGSITVTSPAGMTILVPVNFEVQKGFMPWDYARAGYQPETFFSDPDVKPDSYIDQRALQLCGKHVVAFARAPIAIEDDDFCVSLIVAQSKARCTKDAGWVDGSSKKLLIETATLARGLLSGIAVLAKAKVNDGKSIAQLAAELDFLTFPAALFDELHFCLACNDLFRGYVGPSLEPVGATLSDLHLAPCAFSQLQGGGSFGPYVELANEFQDRGTPSSWSMLWTEIPASDTAKPVVMLTLGNSQLDDGVRDQIENALPFRPWAKNAVQEPTLRFLRETLLSRTIIRRRRTMSYLTVRAWRKPIKAYQIEALRAVKERPSREAVEAAAAEIEGALASLIGFGSFSAIVPMPGGSSGVTRSFSVRVGEALARRVGLPLLLALELEPRRGLISPEAESPQAKADARHRTDGTGSAY